MLLDSPRSASVSPSVSGRSSMPASAPARLPSRPSSSHVMPSEMTTSVCHGSTASESRRAGMSVSNPLRGSRRHGGSPGVAFRHGPRPGRLRVGAFAQAALRQNISRSVSEVIPGSTTSIRRDYGSPGGRVTRRAA